MLVIPGSSSIIIPPTQDTIFDKQGEKGNRKPACKYLLKNIIATDLDIDKIVDLSLKFP